MRQMKSPKAQKRLDVALLIAWGVFFLAVLVSKGLAHAGSGTAGAAWVQAPSSNPNWRIVAIGGS
ncbi:MULTISPECIES: hypothetical protein [Chelativorans]|jgi:hypothetical protein|uniref:hypothetical protein n=1 Tax=Chelativorans TaxID=449972 RepID=UPI00031F497D|nr:MULTISPECIES: hypothetical protein [Chelativorans]